MPQQVTWSSLKLDTQTTSNALAHEMATRLNQQFADYNPLLVKLCISNLQTQTNGHQFIFSSNIVPHVFFPSIRTLDRLPSIGSTNRWESVSKSNPEQVVTFLNNLDPNEAFYSQITHSFYFNESTIEIGFQVTYPEGARFQESDGSPPAGSDIPPHEPSTE